MRVFFSFSAVSDPFSDPARSMNDICFRVQASGFRPVNFQASGFSLVDFQALGVRLVDFGSRVQACGVLNHA